MKKEQKSFLVLAVLIMALFAQTAFANDVPTIYNEAQNLMALGKFTEAANLFDSISTYEDASTLALYCKACNMCEVGYYDLGIASLETLGDFKDAKMRAIYYSGRQAEDNAGIKDFVTMLYAQSFYNQIPLFLDSFSRSVALDSQIEAAKQILYDEALSAGENGDFETARDNFVRIKDEFADGEMRLTYYTIRCDEAVALGSNNLEEALKIMRRYREVGDFLDAAECLVNLEKKVDQIILDRCSEISKAINAKNFSEAWTALVNLEICRNEAVNKHWYLLAEAYLAEKDYDNASQAFVNAHNYSDAEQRVLEPYYVQGEEFLAAQDYLEASAAFKKAGNYSDASQRVLESYYLHGEALLVAEDYAGASEAFKKARNYSDAEQRVLEPYYIQAKSLMQRKDYNNAYDLLLTIRGYRDVDTLLKTDYNLRKISYDIKYAVGNTVTFGAYPQQLFRNGDRPIEWQVLAREGDKALLFSIYGLDNQPYNETKKNVTWETCTLRTWLNEDFLNRAFSAEEQMAILTTTVEAHENPEYNTNPGNSTQDKIFLLSIQESEAYPLRLGRKPTYYAEHEKDVYTDDRDYCGWWLRVPGESQKQAVYVWGVGGNFHETTVDKPRAICPALWVNLDSGIF